MNFPSLFIRCKTKRQTEDLLTILSYMNFKWGDGSEILHSQEVWNVFKEDTVINPVLGKVLSRADCPSHGFSILDYEVFCSAFIRKRRKKWYIRAVFVPEENTWKYSVYSKFIFFKSYLKSSQGTIATFTLEDACSISNLLKIFNLKSNFYVYS